MTDLIWLFIAAIVVLIVEELWKSHLKSKERIDGINQEFERKDRRCKNLFGIGINEWEVTIRELYDKKVEDWDYMLKLEQDIEDLMLESPDSPEIEILQRKLFEMETFKDEWYIPDEVPFEGFDMEYHQPIGEYAKYRSKRDVSELKVAYQKKYHMLNTYKCTHWYQCSTLPYDDPFEKSTQYIDW